ncbi:MULTISPECIES: DeoR/GlpR family DNA-binding transcription regulator [Apibacter]|uniref:DeoR/GlpR family DNA-binding transcription regulator n=1 Tax=Apibacter TaxID=1778601 RepID=UPI000CF98697|nr:MULTISPECIES: DeoR/GlpR family DNA-binding transcription regulator [Apibacter]MCX8677877.1 DeoR/GlpR transcriptional regulator [Apibacter sp. B3919]MXO25170.1 DeoR family transcriptional regulator [Apibacter sp. B3924]MXO27373.1 DeoR family transcriptional regulator [Apibacter sp. B3813]MXO29186.1 DeoR family transcriptional regulator [Apibacter sp. B3913]MXO31311.1 DeoR family transcriptional regulator [Apibacter sp. B3912]
MKNNNINNIRQQEILEELNFNHYVSVTELCKKLNVSAVTIRKDLTHLEKIGKLYRTHGGATRESFIVKERHVNKKETLQVEEKSKIAKAALNFIEDNDFITISSGTTTQMVAQVIENNYTKLTILTSSLKSAMLLYGNPNFDVIQLGGDVRTKSGSVMGPYAELMISNYSCSKLFIGGDGVDFDFGLSTSSTMEAKMNQLMIQNSEKVIVLADSTKISKRGFGKITDLDKIHVLITDEGIKKRDVERFEDLGIEVVIAR